MKNSKSFSFFFIIIMLLMFSSFLEKNVNSDLMDETTDQIFYDRLAYTKNYSKIFIFLEGETLDLIIKCDRWYDFRDDEPKGLLIEIKDDMTETIIESWLILYGDQITHYFKTDQILTGVYQIIFSTMK